MDIIVAVSKEFYRIVSFKDLPLVEELPEGKLTEIQTTIKEFTGFVLPVETIKKIYISHRKRRLLRGKKGIDKE